MGRAKVNKQEHNVSTWKRLIDVAVSVVALVLFSPAMALVALWIKLVSPGPVLYVARRAGLKGRPFGQLKFRTMNVGADRLGSFTALNDPRVIPGGELFRLLRLDELPQFINVLRGEMSVVGPRPEDPEIVAQCYTPRQREVLDALPGLTGIRQLRLFPDCADVLQSHGVENPQQHYREVVLPLSLAMDLEYIRRQGFWYDLYLLAATAFALGVKSWYVPLFGNNVAAKIATEADWTASKQ